MVTERLTARRGVRSVLEVEWGMSGGKFVGLAIVLAAVTSTAPAVAEDMNADEARRFIAGKQFSYQCFEGTTGRGRINADGSVSGYISVRGTQAPRFVVLPAGTLRVKGDQYCASVRGVPFEPCFHLDRTSPYSFRGAVSGFGFAYCDFSRRSARADMSRPPLRLRNFSSSSASASAFADD
jgi:hypothetical protein